MTKPRPQIQLPLSIEGQTVEIPLTKGYTTIVDAIDADLAQVKWRALEDRYTTYAARTVYINRRQVLIIMHRLILSRVIGRPLENAELVDHIDRDGLNNRRNNLRIATNSQNMSNARKPVSNKSGYKGVHWSKSSHCWRAMIRVNGKMMHIGNFDSAEEAYAAYCEAAKKYRGEFARFE